VREFAADIRKKVLEDEVIVFSGVVRQGTDMTINPLYQCCIRFGATVQEEITDQTTTLIAGKAQTE
jgi:NAD-dependent DNA ligase